MGVPGLTVVVVDCPGDAVVVVVPIVDDVVGTPPPVAGPHWLVAAPASANTPTNPTKLIQARFQDIGGLHVSGSDRP